MAAVVVVDSNSSCPRQAVSISLCAGDPALSRVSGSPIPISKFQVGADSSDAGRLSSLTGDFFGANACMPVGVTAVACFLPAPAWLAGGGLSGSMTMVLIIMVFL